MTQTQKPENIPATPGTLRLKGSVSEQMERFFDRCWSLVSQLPG